MPANLHNYGTSESRDGLHQKFEGRRETDKTNRLPSLKLLNLQDGVLKEPSCAEARCDRS